MRDSGAQDITPPSSLYPGALAEQVKACCRSLGPVIRIKIPKHNDRAEYED